MAHSGVKQLPVVASEQPTRLVGIVTLGDLLKSRQRLIEEENRRDRFFGNKAAAAEPSAAEESQGTAARSVH